MKLADVAGRATLVTEGGGIDVAGASGDRFGPEIQGLYDRWDEVVDWAHQAERAVAPTVVVDDGALGSPVPAPRQVFGIGRNYRTHAAETGSEVSSIPATFTKFPSCLTGPATEVVLPSSTVDWEVELVVVLGRATHQVSEDQAWNHVAGLAVGQDLSERTVQHAAGGQFSLGKSYPGFGPIGPWLVTPDELADPDDLAIACTLNGEVVQSDRTSSMIWSVAALLAELSAVVTLWPGDVIFTGTPAGVGFARTPPRFLAPGDELASTIEGIGTIRTPLVAGGR